MSLFYSKVGVALASSSFPPFETLLDEFRDRWERGERPSVESFLARIDPAQPFQASELIYLEYRLAIQAGLKVDSSSFLTRFPEHESSLARLFALDETLATSNLGVWASACRLPEAGDDLGPYHLVRMLGEGGFARVFLAREVDFDDRLLVVKVSTRITAEPRLLARLRHPHVVEVIRQATTADGGLQLICMPFLGGATLGDVFEKVHNRRRKPTTGLDLLKALDRTSAKEYPASEARSPSRDLLAAFSYPKAIAWIVARSAEGLEHANRRLVIHGDVKPSNILLSADGVPMLFDFNLSLDQPARPGRTGASAPAGGTLQYLAPERIKSLLGKGGPGRLGGDQPHRSDLYALGLVLLEGISGIAPAIPSDSPFGPKARLAELAEARNQGLDAFTPALRSVPASLRPIFEHLLTEDPSDRYADGKELAEDLDLWTAERPTRYAEPPSISVVVGRGVRRHRVVLQFAAAALAAVVATGLLARFWFHHEMSAIAVEKYDTLLDNAETAPFLLTHYGTWETSSGNPERILAAYDVEGPKDWRSRPDVRFLDTRDREELEALILEQSYLLAKKLANRPKSSPDWRKALTLVDRTLARSPLDVFQRLRDRLARQLGDARPSPRYVAEAEVSPPPRYLDEYLKGVEETELHARAASERFREVLVEKPGFFWAEYRLVQVACRLNLYEDALQHFRACVRRRPDNPALHTQLAALLYRNHHHVEAMSECEAAMRLEGDFAEAYYTLALLQREADSKEGAKVLLNRFTMIRQGNLTPIAQKRLKPRLDLTYSVHSTSIPDFTEQDEVNFREILADDPDDQVTRQILANHLGRTKRIAESITEYGRILELNPDHLGARYGRAFILQSMKSEEAWVEFESLIAHPRFEELLREEQEAMRLFGLLVAHRIAKGDSFGALRVAGAGLELAERRNLMSHEFRYTVARAWASFARSDSTYLDECARHLVVAEKQYPGILRTWFNTDSLFDPIRPELSTIIRAAGIDLGPDAK